MTLTNTARTRPPRAAPASTTRSCSCRPSAAARHRAVRFLPRGRRRGRRVHRPSLARVKLAWWRTDRPDVRRQARAPGDARAACTCRAVRSRASGCWRWSTAWKWTWTRPATWTGRACANTAGTPPAWWASCRPACSATATRGPWSTPKAGPGVPDDQHHPRRGRRRPPRPHLHPGQRHAAVRGQGLGHPQWRILRALLGADEVQADRARELYREAMRSLPEPTGARSGRA